MKATDAISLSFLFTPLLPIYFKKGLPYHKTTQSTGYSQFIDNTYHPCWKITLFCSKQETQHKLNFTDYQHSWITDRISLLARATVSYKRKILYHVNGWMNTDTSTKVKLKDYKAADQASFPCVPSCIVYYPSVYTLLEPLFVLYV